MGDMERGAMNWDAWFVWLEAERPNPLQPLADFECEKCGKLDCTDEHEDDE